MKINKNRNDLTIGDIRRLQYQLKQLASTTDITIPKIKTGCDVEIFWSVPLDCIALLYDTALAKLHQFDALMYLKCGNYPAIFSRKFTRSKEISTGNKLQNPFKYRCIHK